MLQKWINSMADVDLLKAGRMLTGADYRIVMLVSGWCQAGSLLFDGNRRYTCRWATYCEWAIASKWVIYNRWATLVRAVSAGRIPFTGRE